MINKIKIIIADDNHFFCEALKDSLNLHKELVVTHTATSIQDLIQLLSEAPVDVLILDINFNGISSLDYIKQIRKKDSDFKIITLSTLNNNYTKNKAQVAGVDCFISKDGDFNTFKDTIINCYNNVISLKKNTKTNKIVINNLKFTQRKLEILEALYLHSDKKEKEVAKLLNITESSLKTHKRELFEITNTKNISDLLKTGIQLGILLP